MRNKIAIGLLVCVMASHAARERVESVVAVVDGKVILFSELMSAVQQAGSALGKLSAEEKKQKVLQSLIDEKVVLSRASRDSIFVTDEEVRQRVDAHLQKLMSAQGMDAVRLEKAIRAQLGMTMAQYREQLSRQFHDQFLMARIRQRYLGTIRPTRQEVETFFKEYKDSLPKQYNSIRVSHIQIPVEPSAGIVDSVRRIAERLIDSLDQGVAWDILAARYSQDSAARKGGDMGFWRKGSLEPDFERAASRLDIGQYTDRPVRTSLGWHIIRVLGKRDNEIRTAQIFLRTQPTAQDTADVLLRLDSIARAVRGGASFSELAKKFSRDPETSWKGGDLGWMERGDLDSAYQQVIANLSDGEISPPVQIRNHWHLFRLDESRPVRALSLSEDYATLEEMTANHIGNRRLQSLVEKWRKEVYVEVRLDRR